MSDTSGPAFPALGFVVPHDLAREGVAVLGRTQGMTLRDYFAAKAMQGILAGDQPICKDPDPTTIIAQVAYMIADAMLKERAK